MSIVARRVWLLGLGIVTAVVFNGPEARADDLPTRLRDRGDGMPTSMFGTYIQRGELLVYPFFEYYLDNNIEYKPSEFGYGLEQDFQGKFRSSEGIIYLGYGLTDRIAFEFEAAVVKARQEKSPDDPTAVPAVITEQGTGDIEGQLRVRLLNENERRPEVFGYFEAVSPRQQDKLLIGTQDWELKGGAGLVRGFSWGTVTGRAAGEYSVETSSFDLGEYALEYLKRLSPKWRVYAGFEGKQDELSLITEAQWHFSRTAFLKLNNGLGVTQKATDWAPEIGIMFSFFGLR